PMAWDFCELNPLLDGTGTIAGASTWTAGSLDCTNRTPAVADQADARAVPIRSAFVSTDPPYYDNIGYADLSDFFYVWLRRSLRPVYPHLLATILVPKSEELVATPARHGTKQNAEQFFLRGMTQVMHNVSVQAHPAAPITIYYAFKQS